MYSSLCVLVSVFREKSGNASDRWACLTPPIKGIPFFLYQYYILPLSICSVDMHAFLTEAAKSFPLLPQTHCLSCSASTSSVKYIFSAYKSKIPVPNHLFQWATGNLVFFFHITRYEILIFLSTVYWMTFLSLSLLCFCFFKSLKVKESKNLVSKNKTFRTWHWMYLQGNHFLNSNTHIFFKNFYTHIYIYIIHICMFRFLSDRTLNSIQFSLGENLFIQT